MFLNVAAALFIAWLARSSQRNHDLMVTAWQQQCDISRSVSQELADTREELRLESQSWRQQATRAVKAEELAAELQIQLARYRNGTGTPPDAK